MAIMKKVLLLLFLFHAHFFTAQVGINTTTPNAQLDIRSSSQVAPSNTDGILIPKMDVFPTINPTASQQGMLVYLTTATTFSGNPKPIGFYYWNDSPADWIALKGTDGGTLDQAYDFGGAGNGKTITADAGAVLISGTDGLVSTGTTGSGALAPAGAGTRMVWNPRKAAFRAGTTSGALSTVWDDSQIGVQSVAFGINTVASGTFSVAFGQQTSATGFNSTAFGAGSVANAGQSTAFGNGTVASGINSTSFGSNSVASGLTSTAFGFSGTASGAFSTAFGLTTNASGQSSIAAGHNNVASSFGETVLGIGATIYTPSTNGATQFRSANATDRLFVIGNAIDANNNNIVDLSERSDALLVLKNGLTRLPSTTNTMIDAADGKAVVTKEWLQQNTSGTLDQAYDFGGAGLGRTITADTGAVTINGTDGLVSTGTAGSGAVAPSGVGTRMVWNPRKAAFRAGQVFTNQWDDANIGLSSVAMGHVCLASGFAATAIGDFVSALGLGSTAFGVSSTAFGQASTVFGRLNFANSSVSTAIGFSNTASSYGETVLGIGATIYAHSINGATQFGAANVTDRLFVIGNAIDANNNDSVEFTERSDALVVLKNGNIGIGSSTPQDKLHIVGNLRMEDGNQAAGKVLTSDTNGRATWQNASNNAWGLTGNSGLNASTNFMGTSDDVDVVFKRNGILAGKIASSNTSLGVSAASAITTGVNNNAIGNLALGANTSGNDNNAFGTGALSVNVGGIRNSAFGSFALDNAVGDAQNSAFGAFVLGNNNGGDSNSGLGYNALNANSTGSNNTAMGVDALKINTIGANNTAVGFNAMATINQGSNNTGIGVDTATTSTLTSNATAIGYKATVGASNCVVLGSINGVNGATSSVNVGIGTISPATALEVVDANVTTTATVEGTINVMTNGAQAIDAGGSITLGGSVTDAGTTFRTFGSIEGRKATATTNVTSGYLLFKTNNAGTLSERMRITNAGDIGIGTAAPGGQFELSLNEGRKPTSNTWTIPSDARLKNVNGIYQKGLAEILQLKPIRYNYKNTDKRTFDPKVLDKEAFGFLAQEVQPLFPEAVGTDPDGYLNFDLHPILIASINALKELNAKNEQLEQKSSQLEKENQLLKESVQAINDKMLLIIAEMEKLKK
jgi:hypothetical protein